MHQIKCGIFCLLMGLQLMLGIVSVQAAERLALVIGNSAYRHEPLQNPQHDAEDMRVVLSELGFSVTFKENLNKAQIAQAVAEFAERIGRHREVTAVFYYAGHGIEIRGVSYLIPLQSTIFSEADVASEAYELPRLLANLNDGKARATIVILDACRNNPFARGFRRSSSSRGMRRPPEIPSGSIVASSTASGEVASGEVASDGAYGRNSPYTKHLKTLLKEPGWTIDKVFREVRKAVLRETQGQQVPWESTSLTDDIYLRLETETKRMGTVIQDTLIQDTLRDGSLGPKLVYLEGGRYQMGSPEGEEGRDDDERQHRVRVGDFYLGQYEVTVGEFERFVEAESYQTEAERDGGCYSWTGSEWKKKPEFN